MKANQSFIESYKEKHQHPLNKLTHNVGIPLIVVSLVVVFFSWKIALAMFVGGWILQFVGHFIEGNQPAFFKNPVYLIIGPVWLAKRLLAKIGIIRPVKSEATIDEATRGRV